MNNFNTSLNSHSKLNHNIKNQKDTSPLYNNLMERNISKVNLNVNNVNQKNIVIKKPSFKQILSDYLCCSKSHYTIKLENIRVKVLSEEKLFTSYFILVALSDIFLKKYLFNNNNIINNNTTNLKKKNNSKKNSIWTPQQNIFISPAKI